MKLRLKIKTAMATALIGAGTLLLYSCNEVGNGYGLNENGDTLVVVTTIKFSANVLPIFTTGGKCTGCHAPGGSGYTGTGGASGGLDLTTPNAYASLMGTGTGKASFEKPTYMRIQPGSPDSSYLYQKIIGSPSITLPVATRMPLGGTPLTETQINTIKTWIQNGAQND